MAELHELLTAILEILENDRVQRVVLNARSQRHFLRLNALERRLRAIEHRVRPM